MANDADARREALAEQFEALDAQWDAPRADATARRKVLERLEELYRLLSFFERWSGQIRERLVQFAV